MYVICSIQSQDEVKQRTKERDVAAETNQAPQHALHKTGSRPEAALLQSATLSIALLALPNRRRADRVSLRQQLDMALHRLLDLDLRRRCAPRGRGVRVHHAVPQLESHLGRADYLHPYRRY